MILTLISKNQNKENHTNVRPHYLPKSVFGHLGISYVHNSKYNLMLIRAFREEIWGGAAGWGRGGGMVARFRGDLQ